MEDRIKSGRKTTLAQEKFATKAWKSTKLFGDEMFYYILVQQANYCL